MAGLQRQLVPVALGGVDSKSDEKLVLNGRMITVENMTLEGPRPDGPLTLAKRSGHTSLPAVELQPAGLTTDITEAEALGTFNQNELLMFSSGTLRSYSTAGQGWSQRGFVSPLGVSVERVLSNTAEQTMVDCARAEGIEVVAWKDSRGGVRASVIDTTTGTTLQSDVLIDSDGDRPRCATLDGFIFIFYVTSTPALRAVRLVPAEPMTFQTSVTVATDLEPTSRRYDVVQFPYSGSQRLLAVYPNTTTTVRTMFLTSYLGSSGPATSVPATNVIGLDVSASPSQDRAVLNMVSSTEGALISAWDTLLTPLLDADNVLTVESISSIGAAPVSVTCAVEEVGNARYARVFYETSASIAADRTVRQCVVNLGAATVGTPSVFSRSTGLSTKAFIERSGSSGSWVGLVHESPLQPTYFLARSDGHIGGRWLYTTAAGLPPSGSAHLPRPQRDAQTWRVGCGVQDYLPDLTGSQRASRGAARADLDFGAVHVYQSAQLGDNLHVAGGILSDYDGVSCFEHGFLLFPEAPTFTSGSGGSITTGTRLYRAVYEWTDARGQLHRSAPSPAVSVTNGATFTAVTASVPTMRLTARTAADGRSEANVCLYRTEDNGTLYYKVGTGTNSTTTDRVSIVDTTADGTSLISRQPLYTNGGVPAEHAPEAASIVVAGKNRLFMAGLSSDPNTIVYSQPREPLLATGFPDQFSIRVPSEGGPITALHVLDDQVLAFKADRVFRFSGDGPDGAGRVESAFTQPQLVSTDVGCEDPQTIVQVPQGLMFRSAKGIYLMDRGLTVSYVGAAVEAFNDREVSSGVLVPGRNLIRLTTTEGPTLSYDYLLDQWATNTGHACRDIVDSTVWRGQHVVLRRDGEALVESSAATHDGDAVVRAVIETPWFHMAGIQGFQRVYRVMLLGRYRGPHMLRASWRFDNDPAYVHTQYWVPGQHIATDYYGAAAYYGSGSFGVGESVYQVELRPPIQRCTSFGLKIEDWPVEVSGSGLTVLGDSFTLSDITVEVGVLPGMTRFGTGRRAG